MNRQSSTTLAPPRMVDGAQRLLAGITKTHRGSNAGMPAQWGEFSAWLGRVPGQLDGCAYGVLYNDTDAGVDYLTGVEVADLASVPEPLTGLRIGPQRYAVFLHAGPVAAVMATWDAIWADWLPQSGYRAAGAPIVERYPESFDPQTGNGGFELWIPVEAV